MRDEEEEVKEERKREIRVWKKTARSRIKHLPKDPMVSIKMRVNIWENFEIRSGGRFQRRAPNFA